MPRFGFVFLIVTSPLFFATENTYAQEVEIGAVPATSASVDSAMGVGSEVDGKKIETNQIVRNTARKNPSLLEEFFSSPLNYILVLVVCLYVYLMFVQPRGARLEKRGQLERLKQLKKNDRVVTSAGIHGIVSNINTDAGTVTLRVDENSNAKLTIDRDSIRSVAS